MSQDPYKTPIIFNGLFRTRNKLARTPVRARTGFLRYPPVNGCARFGIRKTLKFKAFVPRTHRNASNMPASPFYSKTRALEPVDESRGARIGGGTAVAPCGARGGPGAAQARLPSHAVALHPPPVHPCVRPLREVPCRHGAERRRRASEARAWGAQPPALSGSDEWRQRRSRTAAARR